MSINTINKAELSLSSNKLSNISHELKTPLNSINALTKIMLDESVAFDDAQSLTSRRSFLRVVYESAIVLDEKVEQLVSFFRIRSDSNVIKLETSDFSSIIRSLREQFDKTNKIDKTIDFVVVFDESSLERIVTDNFKLTKALSYILDNAIKFSDKGTITLTVSQEVDSEYPISICLSDTGIGIPDDQQDYIFEEFAQVDESIARKFEGLGLGLTIAKGIVERLSGKIVVTSELGKGSCFQVLLPSTPIHLRHPISISNLNIKAKKLLQFYDLNDQDLSTGSGAVLLVDDDMVSNYVMKSVLKTRNIKFVIAENGEAAIKVLKLCPEIRMIITDLRMPIVDGYGLINFVRSDKRLCRIPIIVVTSSVDDEKNVLDFGADAYIRKPLALDKLFHILDRLLS